MLIAHYNNCVQLLQEMNTAFVTGVGCTCILVVVCWLLYSMVLRRKRKGESSHHRSKQYRHSAFQDLEDATDPDDLDALMTGAAMPDDVVEPASSSPSSPPGAGRRWTPIR